MQSARLLARLQREITMLKTDPPPGVCAWPHNDLLTHLEAQIQGPANTVYSRGLFKLDVQVPERYPFEPPSVKFVTPIYHPNIDSAGRICLDILNMPPKGAWKPSLNIPTVLTSIGLLLSEPNPDDGLMGDITAEYKHRRSSFDRKARQMTEQHALPSLRQDTGDQNTTSTSSIVKTVPLDGKVSNSTPSADGKCDMKMLGGDHLAPDNQASSSGRCKVSEAAAATPGRQRLALGRKLSLTKSEHLSADVQAKQQHPSPSRPLAVEGNENLPPANLGITTKRQEDDIQPAHQKTPSKCKATSQVQNLDPNLPRSNESGLTSKPTSDQSAKPSRLSLLSRLKMSRPRLSQQKPPSSTPHQSSLSVVKEADCTVVSDSESDSEEIPAPRSRLSLTQRGFAGKRKASLL